MKDTTKWVVLIFIIIIWIAISLAAVKIEKLEDIVNDEISMSYEQVNDLNLQLDNIVEKLDRSHHTLVPLGTFTITYYCNDCDICGTNNVTTDGTELVDGMMSVATDPNIIPTGTVLQIDGKQYVANDTGGAIKGNRIDIMVYGKTHEEVLAMGVDHLIVYAVESVKI